MDFLGIVRMEEAAMAHMEYGGNWIEARLVELADCSQKEGGIWRAAYTPEEAAGKALLAAWIKEAGLDFYEDAVGNIYGRLAGKKKKTILVGSHIDTVKDGGRYDGAAGVVTGIAALGQLKAMGYEPEYSLEVAGLLEEEGSRYASSCHGSRAIMGILKPEALKETDSQGISLEEAMKEAGYQPHRLAEARREDLAAYIELHIEQGAVLEQRNAQIGIVEGIVGIVNYDITIRGRQNHAGTTPMELRRDPVVQAARLIALTEKVCRDQGGTRATFGKLESFPGMQNVIAERVFLTLDMRDGSREALKEWEGWFLQQLGDIEAAGFQVEAVRTQWSDPVKMDQGLTDLAQQAAEEEGLSFLRLSSGAGHDAMVFAERIPTAMIFVPSAGGISHNPLEYTSKEDLQAGFSVLCRLLRRMTERSR